jgi:hypothetical protein
MSVDLSDACALFERARHHLEEFNELIVKRNMPQLWNVRSRQDESTGTWVYSITIDRDRLLRAKPVMADAATNAISALDHVAAAMAKSRGHDRVRTLYFPLAINEEAYRQMLARVEPYIGSEMAALITDVRAKRFEHIHAQAAKEISNSGKHWELLPSDGSILALAFHEPDQPQRIFQVPKDAFSQADKYVFHSGEQLPNVPISIVVGLSVDGLPEGLPKSPDTILECTLRYVEAVIEAVNTENQKN